MPTLGEVYEQRLDGERRRDRPILGLALLAVGVAMVLFGGIVAFSDTAAGLFGATIDWEMWGLGALFAGTGLPVAFAGVFVVVPAPLVDRAIAATGILVSLLGVLFFDYAYPHMWYGDPTDLTPLVFAVYTLGALLMFGALFRSVLDIEISLPRSSLSFEYQGGRGGATGGDGREPVSVSSRPSSGSSDSGGVGVSVGAEAHDAEVVTNNAPEPDPDEDPGPSPGFSGDAYCGNCAFYELVEESGASANLPYCDYHERRLEDLEACEAHEMRLSPTANE